MKHYLNNVKARQICNGGRSCFYKGIEIILYKDFNGWYGYTSHDVAICGSHYYNLAEMKVVIREEIAELANKEGVKL